MAIRVRNSKIVTPQLPEIVHRPRLQRFVQKNRNKRLVLIQGQAAQGKSTLAASCAQTILPETAWVNLAPEDSEASHLFHVLVHSFKQCMKWLDISKLVSYPAIDMGPRMPRFRYREWAYVMFDGISDPLYIVLDGLDRLDDDGSSLILIQELMGQSPAHIHFILLSREEPPLEIQKFRVARQAAILNNEDLAFNFDEICFFFNQVKSFDLSTDALKKIHQITEGWVGGVVLISEHLDHLPVKDRQADLFNKIPERFKEAVFQYFLEEVLRSQPTHMYEFLIRSSVFDIIEPKLVERVLKIDKCQEFLLDLNRKNLFVHSRYHEQKGWEFEYHQLFKEFLQSKFRVQVTESQKQDIYLNSGDLFEKTGDFKKAIEFYIHACAYDKAIACIEKIGMFLLENGRNADLIRWLDVMPENRVNAQPWLVYFQCMTRRFTGVKENLKCLPAVMAAFREQNSIKGEIQSLSAMLEAVIAAGLGWNILEIYLEQAKQLLVSVPGDVCPYEKAFLLSQYGYGHTVHGNLQTGHSALQEAFSLAWNLGNQVLQITVACHMVVNLTAQNEFCGAQRYVDMLDKLDQDSVMPESRIFNLIAKSIMASFRGEHSTARQLLDSADHQVEDNGLVYYQPIVLMYRVFYCVFCNRHAEMTSLGNQLLSLAASMKNQVMVASTTFFLGLNAYRSQDLERAEWYLNQADRLCSPEETNTQMQWHAGKVVACLVGLNQGKTTFKESEIHGALAYFRKEGSICLVAETYMVLSLIEKQRKQDDQAKKSLSQGFEMSLQAEYHHFLMLSRSDIIAVCLSALALPCKKIQQHAASFLCQQPFDICLAELEKRTAMLFEQNLPDQAVRLSVLADCPEKGAQMILHHAPVLWTRGDFRMLEQMIDTLPRNIIDASPHLIFWHGMCRLPVSPHIAMERLVHSLDMFDAQDDPDGCFVALSGVLNAVYCQFNGFQNSDLFLEKVVQYETRFGKTKLPGTELKLTGAVLHSLIFRDPVSDAARKWIDRGWKISQQIEDIHHAAPVFLPMILLRILQGNLSGAGHLLKRFEKVTPERISPMLYLVMQSLKAFHAWLSGDFDAGLQAVEQGLAMEKETGINLMFSSFRVQGAASAIGAGQYELAEKFLDEITPVVSHQGLWMQGWYHFVFAWLVLVTGNPGACRLHALAGFEKLNQTGCEMALACCHLMMSKMHDLFNEKQEAHNHLNQSLALCEKYGVEQCRFMSLLTRASFLMDQDTDDDQVASSLRAAMRLGSKQLYRFGFAWNPEEMADLCAQALKRDIEPDYVRSLIMRYRFMPKTPPLEIRQWPWPVTLYCLGEFKVMVNDEMVGFSRKTQYKPLAMLKFVVARRGRHVPDYAVQDALWPDSDGDAAHNAFTTTLHRLRSLLKTPDGLIHREGSLSCNIRMIWTDIWAFEHICRLIENHLNDPRPDDRISPFLDDMLAFYRGPFIPEDPAEWAIVERQRLKALFVDTIQKIARRFERQRRWQEAIRCYRLALNVEALAEVFYENLMRIYAKMGKPGEALLVYRQYKAVLQAGLGLSPSSRMNGLCRAICGRASGI
jgi:ATP/maltotriose-dependent transcriptional regulator MalT/DNA-binding SARP family transcriptional activator